MRAVRRTGVTAAAATGIVLGLASAAWACAPLKDATIKFAVAPTSSQKTVTGGDPRAVGDTGDATLAVDVSAAGYAEAPVYPSSTSPNKNLYLGSTNVSRDTINNTTCDAAGTPIGFNTMTITSVSASRHEVHGTGTISANLRPPGTYIACAGANSDVLWDFITLA